MSSSLLDHPLISSRYFFPRGASLDRAFFVTAADGVSRLACYRASPYDGAPTLLHFHGNGEVVGDYLPEMASIFSSLGVNVLFAEYRGYGASTGSPTLGAILDDAETIFAALGEPPHNIVLFGRSLGSLCAIELASRHPDIRGLILDSGIADAFERILLRVSPEELGVSEVELESAVARRLDHRSKLARYPGPLLVLHALHDALVDCSHAERNGSWSGARPEDKELVLFSRGSHNTIFFENRERYITSLRLFLDRIVRARPLPSYA
jgi:pimeloyl-ACP methyl ester carboxylesterase